MHRGRGGDLRLLAVVVYLHVFARGGAGVTEYGALHLEGTLLTAAASETEKNVKNNFFKDFLGRDKILIK